MEKRKTFTLRLTDEEMEKLEMLSREQGMTKTKYLTNIITDAMEPEGKDHRTDTFKINISKEDKELLMKKSSELGLSMSEYVRDIIGKKSLVNLSIQVDDLHELLEEVNILSQKLNGVVSVIRQAGTVYDQDIITMINIFKSIDNTCNNIYMEERAARYKLYDEAKKKVYEDVRRQKVKPARRGRKAK